jgi:hypothetical protein
MPTKLRKAVQCYCATHLHPSRVPFAVYEYPTMTAWEGEPPSYQRGCYAVFSAAGELLYIGKASLKNTIGGRLVEIRKKPMRNGEIAVSACLVTVHDHFEAPSLEEFLIRELRPKWNSVGRHPEQPSAA